MASCSWLKSFLKFSPRTSEILYSVI